MNEVNILFYQGQIDKATYTDKINIIKAELIQKGLQNELIKEQTETQNATQKEIESKITLNKQQLSNWVQDNQIKWQYLSNDEKRIEIQKLGLQITEDQNKFNNVMNIVNKIMTLK